MYCSKFKHISYPVWTTVYGGRAGSGDISMDAVKIILSLTAKAPRHGVLFSSLQTFESRCATDATMLLLSTFPSNLKVMAPQIDGPKEESISHFFRELPQRCPNIVKLQLKMHAHLPNPFAYGSALVMHVHNFVWMEEFDIAHSLIPMTDELLIALSSLPKLRCIQWRTYVGDADRAVNSRQVLALGCFPSLEELRAGIVNDDMLKRLVTPHFLPIHLKKATAQSFEHDTNQLSQYLEILAPDDVESNIEFLRLDHYVGGIEFNAISRITTMHRLKNLKIQAPTFFLSDQHIAQLLSGLPVLEYIQFGGEADPATRPGNPTLLTVHYLIKYCPLLRRAHLFLDAREIPNVPHPIVTEKQSGNLLRLMIQGSAVGDPTRVAEWLRDLLSRRYDRIRIKDPRVFTMGGDFQVIGRGWSKVQEVLGHDMLGPGEKYDDLGDFGQVDSGDWTYGGELPRNTGRGEVRIRRRQLPGRVSVGTLM